MEPMIHKTTTTTTEHTQPTRRAAINGLAVVGFIALVFIGITLAIYAARYVPETVSRLGSANVYFSSLFGGDEGDNDLEVVPGDSVPLPTDETATSTDSSVATSTEGTVNPDTTPVTPRPGTPTTVTVPVTVPQTLYGKADLTVRVTETGYLRSANTNSFVKDNEVPEGERPAIKFRVTNVGTNKSGTWNFEAKLPTTSSYTYKSSNQQSLMPGQFIDFTLGFDRAKDGENRISLEIDSQDDVDESNERNNTTSVEIEVED